MHLHWKLIKYEIRDNIYKDILLAGYFYFELPIYWGFTILNSNNLKVENK